MCMLFGFTGNQRYELNSSLQDFYSHSTKHPHGWGLAVVVKKESAAILKEPVAAYESSILEGITKTSVPGRLAIGHIRYKTVGEVGYTNTHPFVQMINGKQWILAHNGSVEAPDFNKLRILPEGESDSERVFCYIVQELTKLKNPELYDEIQCIESCIHKLSAYGKLNLLVTDGQHLFVHSNYKDSLYVFESSGVACFATMPLTRVASKTRWKKVALNRLLVYQDGCEIYRGQAHRNQYYRPYNTLRGFIQ